MKHLSLAILCLSITTEIFAQNELVFNNDPVVSISFIDYEEIAHGNSCMLCYIDTSKYILVAGNPISKKTGVYKKAMREMQNLLDEIGHNRKPSSVDFGITAAVLRMNKLPGPSRRWGNERCTSIRKRTRSLDTFNIWLQENYPVYDEGTLSINTIPDPCGMKIIVQTDKKIYYFDMRDIELFQPYLMRTSDQDCLKQLTNFCINKHLYNIFMILKIDRKIPFTNEVIESYNVYCAKDYVLY